MGFLSTILRRGKDKANREPVNYRGLLLALAVLAVATWINNVLTRMHWWVKQPYTDPDMCSKTSGILGAEDITLVKDGLFVASSDDRLALFELKVKGPDYTASGGLFAIWEVERTQGPRLHRLDLGGFPSDQPFHPHGIFMDRKASKLYVVSHAYAGGGERIETFHVQVKRGSTPPLELKYEGKLPLPAGVTDQHAGLNDLVMLGEDEAYITQWLALPDGPHGHGDSGGLYYKLNRLLLKLLLACNAARPPIHHCTGLTTSSPKCRKLAVGLGQVWNGIALSPDRSRLLVVDSVGFVRVFRRDAKTGDLTLGQVLKAGHYLDNIEPDHFAGEGKEAYTVATLWGREHLLMGEEAKGKAESSLVTKRVSSGASRIWHDGQQYHIEDEVFLNGTAISGVSSAVRVAPSGALLLGSWYDNGVLICKGV